MTSNCGVTNVHTKYKWPLLRSEIPSGMCAKLCTVAASNNRDHPTRSLYYCLFAPRTCIFVLRAHPVRGESHNQRNATGEVATLRTWNIYSRRPGWKPLRQMKEKTGENLLQGSSFAPSLFLTKSFVLLSCSMKITTIRKWLHICSCRISSTSWISCDT